MNSSFNLSTDLQDRSSSACAALRERYEQPVNGHCPPGFFLHRASGINPGRCRNGDARRRVCRRCTACPPGIGAVRPCGRRTDTVCQPCEHGTSYADLTSHDQPCLRCTRCSQFAVVERNCTVMYDATCHRCRKGRLTKPIYAFAAISKLIVARSNTGLRNEIWQIR